MHDPLVVAFEIKRPWPRSYKARTVNGEELPAHRYWPALVTVWHREPGGHDSGEVCRHYRRDGDRVTVTPGWRFHVHHWKIQVPPLQKLRRRLLTRCTWCGGRSTKGDAVDVSKQWDGSRGRWWRGEPGLYHGNCSAIASAHAACLCESPVLEHDGWGQCARCGKQRAHGRTEENLAVMRKLAEIPAGARQTGSGND